MKAKKREEEGGDKDCKEKAAAALVTQLATALVCCHSKLSSTSYESFAVVKVTSYLDWGEKKSSHSEDVFSNAGLNLKLACVLNI